MAARRAWRTAGFRLALGLGFGRIVGIDGPPSGRLLGPLMRLGVRLDEQWSLMASFQYLAASQTDGLSGLRFAGTLEPTYHFWGGLSLALGGGFGGLVEGRTLRPDPPPVPNTLPASYTFADASKPLARCQGVGVTGLGRLEWMAPLGQKSATGFTLEGFVQWTGCVDDANRVEPDTAEPIVRRQFWPHAGFTLAWQVAWR